MMKRRMMAASGPDGEIYSYDTTSISDTNTDVPSSHSAAKKSRKRE